MHSTIRLITPFLFVMSVGNSCYSQSTDAIAENMLVYQRSYGGWPKALGSEKVNYNKVLTEQQKKEITATADNDDATIDNKATSREIVYLIKAYAQTKNQHYLDAARKGIDYVLKAQYSNGGWPQYYPDKKFYRAEITFNDDAIVNVLNILLDIAQQSGDYAALGNEYVPKAQAAVNKGIACIIKAQFTWKGQLTAWAAQYDQHTLLPAKARAYELPSLASSESVNIVMFLMRISNPSPEIKTAITSAIAWFEQTKITGFKTTRIDAPAESSGKDVVLVADPASVIWARFYDLNNMQPLFCGRDGLPKTKLADIENERRTGYAWYGSWPKKLLEQDYLSWKNKWMQ
jgi:PelA/Pel-15E family pectate lyase